MRFLDKICLILLISYIKEIDSIDPFGIGGIALSLIYSTWDYLKCSKSECCHKPIQSNKLDIKSHRNVWIDYNLKDLENNLNTKLYGQHLVKNIITKLIDKHFMKEKPEKALVLSFHGWTGGGKTFVSKIVAKSIFRKYRESLKSNFVHHIILTHFNADNQTLNKIKIKEMITKGVKLCERSLFIFDEIDKFDSGLIDIIKPFIDYNPFVGGIDYTKAIFIFLSNTGGAGIANKAYEFYLEGKERTELTIKDLEPLINSGAFNQKGGLYLSDIVEKNLIDAYVPFLPLEKKHIELCIQDYLKENYNKSNPKEDPGIEFIKTVSNEMEYFPPDTKLYSKTGCKRVGNKVDALM